MGAGGSPSSASTATQASTTVLSSTAPPSVPITPMPKVRAARRTDFRTTDGAVTVFLLLLCTALPFDSVGGCLIGPRRTATQASTTVLSSTAPPSVPITPMPEVRAARRTDFRTTDGAVTVFLLLLCTALPFDSVGGCLIGPRRTGPRPRPSGADLCSGVILP